MPGRLHGIIRFSDRCRVWRVCEEVAKGALRVLARAGSGLPTHQVVRLLLEMARAGMGPELNALAAVLSAPGVRKAPEVVALAAAVAPDEALCQQTLSQAGLVALAALYTHAWRAGNALQARYSYTYEDIVFHQCFAPVVFPNPNGGARIDFSKCGGGVA